MMLKYVRFIIWLINKRFAFFKYSVYRQALLLEKKKLHYQAGLRYCAAKDYDKALNCFKKCSAYKKLMETYEHLGLISEALQIADEYHYYKEGALICEKVGNKLKAAYFYSYFNPLLAARLYKKERHFFEAGLCYLQKFQFTYATDCFYKCPNPLHRIHGLKQVEEIAIVFYFQKQYKEAFKLFIRIKDYYSALECAKQLDNPLLIQTTTSLILDAPLPLAHPLITPQTSSIYSTLSDTLKQLSA